MLLRRENMLRKKSRLSKIMAVVLLFMMVFSFNMAFVQEVALADSGAIWTTNELGAAQDKNIYTDKGNVYLNGDNFASGATLYVRVTAPGDKEALWDKVDDFVITADKDGKFGPIHLLDAVGNYGNNNGEYKVEVSDNKGFTKSKKDNFKIAGELGSIQVKKIFKKADGTSATPEIVNFSLTGALLEKPETASTNVENGIALFKNLAPGVYVLAENVPEGYTTDLNSTNNQVTVVAGAVLVSVTVTNTKDIVHPPVVDKGTIEILKTNSYQVPQPGIEFKLYTGVQENGRMVYTDYDEVVTKTDNAGKLSFSGLDLTKSYYLSEGEHGGYTSSLIDYTPVTFGDDYKAVFNVVNTPIPEAATGTLEILKTTSQGTPQSGVEFKLYTGVQGEGGITYTDYDNVVTKTDSAGKLSFSGLDLSKNYYLSEVIPSGYSSNLREYTKVTFGEDNKATIRVINTRNNGDDGEDGDDEPITPDEEDDVTTPGNNNNPTPPSDNHEQPTPPEPQPVTPPEEPKVSAPAPKPSPELPYTGGNTMDYLLTGSAFTGLVVLIRRFKR